ncbi:MAG TPA: LuxR C-terminal-related transcriptional regulator [Lacisediminihabitans sp.]|uniref:helix-turn-helix transcriptional regulator n=1 Tax=Lacisediminihabitans sp. TaxID=2787631 RepID=UPI002ED8E9D8
MGLPTPLPYDVLAASRARVIAAAETAPSAQGFFAAVSAALADLVPTDAAGWFGVDPTSLLPSWPARIENVAPGDCDSYWEREFLQDDVLQLRSLASGAQTTGTLRAELDGLMNRSVRYREFMAPRGYEDELRSTFRTGDSTWGVTVLLRGPDLPAFSPDEVRFIASLSQPLAEALRTKVLAGHPVDPSEHGSGVLSFDTDGRLIASNDAARYWLDQLPNNADLESVPVAVFTALGHARAVEAGRARGEANVLLSSRSGRWLTVRASALRGPTGEARAFAVTIEPTARKELAPMLAEAYGLSRRELEVTQRLARGESTATIAEALFLSEHTIRDHVKAVLTKTGLSSRAALVAHLFFEYGRASRRRDEVHV